jgi:AmmeMemoRadiSam system protein A
LAFDLSLQEGKFLIDLARNAIREYLETRKIIEPPENTPKKLFENCGVFVTINQLKSGTKKLRGCIGYPYPTNPLVEAVIDSAINAATQDPRFYPLSSAELQQVIFEVSVQS